MITLREWQIKQKPINDLIFQASSTDGCDKPQPFPIGMNYSYIYNYQKGDLIQIGDHKNTVLCAISETTDIRRRPKGLNRKLFINNLNNNNIKNKLIDQNIYFDLLPSYKFIISPEGNGIDCHRHYEALIAGCIPIIEYNKLIENKYKKCPILFTKDYSEINEEYLLKKYNEMIDNYYDFSCLFLSYYNNKTQINIKKCGNYWINKITNTIWYK